MSRTSNELFYGLVPPIARLRRQRDDLAAGLEFVSRDREQFAVECDRLQHENRRLMHELDKVSRERDGLAAELDFVQRQLDESGRQCVASTAEAAVASSAPVVPSCVPGIAGVSAWFDQAPAIESDEPIYSVVLSSGRTGTQWLTAALNCHDEVFFSHGQDLDPRKRTTSAEYQLETGRIYSASDKFDFNDYDAYFDMLENVGSYRAYGNIHGIMSPDGITKPGGFRRRYRGFALTRHPIVRAESFSRTWDATVVGGDFLQSNADYCQSASAKYGIDLSDLNDVLFVRSVYSTLYFDHGYYVSNVAIAPMERVVSDINFFLYVFNFLTAGHVHANPDYLAKVKALAPVGEILSKNSTSVAAVVSTWPKWKRRFFRDELETLGLREFYRNYGYELDRFLF